MLTLGSHWLHLKVCSPFWRLFYGFTAGVWVTCAGRRYEPRPNQAIILPDGVPFNCGSAAGAEHLWLHFSMHLTKAVSSVSVLELPVGPEFCAVATALRQAVTQQQPAVALHLGAALLHVALAGLDPEWWAVPGRRLQRVLDWLEHNAGSPIANERLAVQAGLGVEAFIRWFKARTGRTPAAFVAEWRVREACRRLAYGDDSIEQVAEGLGFSNRHHFSRVFKHYAGCGPATFRCGRGNT